MFRFQNPDCLQYLYGLPVLILLFAGYWRWRKRTLARLGQMDRLLPVINIRQYILQSAGFVLAIGLLIIALANPERGSKMQKVTQRSSDIYIVLDISVSMWCQDVAPNRMDQATFFARKLVQKLGSERVGLIFFAGEAFMQMPLSTDHPYMIELLNTASPTMVSMPGSNLETALELAAQSFDQEEGAGRAIVLISDGESYDGDPIDQTASNYDDGILTYAVGVGTTTGGPIPYGDPNSTVHKRNDEGQEVITRHDERAMRKIAQEGKGIYVNVSESNAAVDKNKTELDGLQKREMEVRSYAQMDSYFQYFLLPALLILFALFAFNWKGR